MLSGTWGVVAAASDGVARLPVAPSGGGMAGTTERGDRGWVCIAPTRRGGGISRGLAGPPRPSPAWSFATSEQAAGMCDQAAGDDSLVPSAAAGNRPTAWWSRSGLLFDVLIVSAVVVAMAGPVLFAQWRLQAEARNGMWLGSVMAHSISHGLPPTFFLNTNTGNASGIFNPLFAFYGSPLFAGFGTLIKVLGDNVPVAFGVLIVLAFAAAYGGSAWTTLAMTSGIIDNATNSAMSPRP